MAGAAQLVGFLLDLWTRGSVSGQGRFHAPSTQGLELQDVLTAMSAHADATEASPGSGGTRPLQADAGGAVWVDRAITLGTSFRASYEVPHLWEGCQVSLVLTVCDEWHLAPLDVFPSELPPSTLVVRVSRLDIDRGVFEIKVFARGPEGDTSCLGAFACFVSFFSREVGS